MSNLDLFNTYSEAFEQSYADDDWERLGQYFAPDAVYAHGNGDDAVGRDAILGYLQGSVSELDRKFDSREFVDATVSEDGDTVTLAFGVRYAKAGLPDLVISGRETATYVDGVISRLEDTLDAATTASMGEWMSQHGASLG